MRVYLGRRLRRRPAAIVLSAALALTVGADVAVLTGGATGAVGVHRHSDLTAERQYVARLRPVAARIYAAVSPAQNVVDRIAEPHAGDAFSARDALGHGDALSLLRSARRSLVTLTPPHAMASAQRQMVTGTAKMVAALSTLHGLSTNENSLHLLAVINGVGSTQLSNAEARYDNGLRAAFRVVHGKSPRDFRGVSLSAPPSRTGWIFSADRSCNAAEARLLPLAKYRNTQSVSAGESIDKRWHRVLTKTEKTLASLPRPHHGSALPRTLRARLRVLTYTAAAFARELTGLRDRSQAAVIHAIGQARAAEPSMRVLGRAMRAYGAVGCGMIVSVWGGRHPTATSGHPSLNT